MDPFHEQLARIALDAAESFGFALAGGYAVQAHGAKVELAWTGERTNQSVWRSGLCREGTIRRPFPPRGARTDVGRAAAVREDPSGGRPTP